MPFTFSHIAFALPIKKFFRDKISTTGLVIGSMLPDVEYYLRMTMYGTWGHTWRGILLFEVPIGIIVAFIFHLLIRDQLIQHLPKIWKSRVAKYLNFDWNNYFINNWFTVVYSMYVGIATHMLLDVFTHRHGYIFGIGFDILNSRILDIAIYQWNQIILSILGLVLLFFVFYVNKKTSDIPKIATRSKLRYWITFLLLFISIYLIRIQIGIPSEKLIIQHMVVFCSSISISLLITSLFSRFYKRNSTY